MPKARIAMNKIREILRLHESSLSNRMISRALKVSRPVVADYISQAAAAGLTWEEAQQLTDEQVVQQLQHRPAVHAQGPGEDLRSCGLHQGKSRTLLVLGNSSEMRRMS